MSLRFFLDANVLFAAAYNPGGTPSEFIATAASLEHKLYTTQYARHEVEKNLRRKAPGKWAQWLRLKAKVEDAPEPESFSFDLDLKAKDIPIYRAAQYNDCDYLITGDIRDFAALKGRNDIHLLRILLPQEGLKLLKQARDPMRESLANYTI